MLGLAHARRRQPEPALMHLSKAIELNPSFALGHAGLGYALAAGGQPERGLEALEQAHRLSPRDPFLAIYAPTVRYMALFALGRYEETIDVCRATIALHPNHAGAWRLMTVSLGSARQDRRGEGGAGADAEAAARSVARPCREKYGLRRSRGSRAVSRRPAQGRAGSLGAGPPQSPLGHLLPHNRQVTTKFQRSRPLFANREANFVW